jgi:hypothetical protein
MSDTDLDDLNHPQDRMLPAGGGIVIAAIFGSLGIGAALAVWLAGAGLVAALAIYLSLPVTLTAIFAAALPARRRPSRRVRGVTTVRRHA